MQKPQCSTFKIATCETFLNEKQNLDFFQKKKKKGKPTKKKIQEQKPFFHILHLCTKFQSPRSNNHFFSKSIRCSLINFSVNK